MLKQIEIPIIQRDYAQGRNTPEVRRIRKRFLDSIYHAVTTGSQLKLDFVYGDIRPDGTLVPLDGQQRLTTLFLLHWYVARHERVADADMQFLRHFSYATRYSARKFCANLVEYTPDFGIDRLSDDITDQCWMPLDWMHDPTISAMLNMLDDIHRMFRSTSGIWPRLEHGCVAFYFLPVKDMGLTDELYIKMNSRGKPLTEFEHFKAEWEGCLAKADAYVASRIGRKIDTVWTDMLWRYKDEDNVIDDCFVRFFRYLCALIYWRRYPDESMPDDLFDLTRTLFLDKAADAVDNAVFVEEVMDSMAGIDIARCFDTFLTNNQHVDGKSHVDEEVDVFRHCCYSFGERYSQRVRSFSIGRMLLLYSFLLYVRHRDEMGQEMFARRLRIVNNLIKNSEFELRADRMPWLLAQTEEIILHGEIRIVPNRTTFNATQLQEEVDKEAWIAGHKDKEKLLYLLEDHQLLYGGIGVVGLDNIDLTHRFYSLFECDRSLVNCALLAIGDYSLLVRWRYQIGSANIDTSWKALFHTNRDNVVKVRGILHELLMRADQFDNALLRGLIDQYLATTTHFDWRYYLVRYPSMRPEKYGMYYWYDYANRGKASYRILMMMTEKSIGGRNYNIFLKTLYDMFVGAYPDRPIRLGDYAYQGDGSELELSCIGCKVHFTDTQFVVESVDSGQSVMLVGISQDDGVDTADRIALAWGKIEDIMQRSSLTKS